MEEFKIYYKTENSETQYVHVKEPNFNSAVKTAKLFCKQRSFKLLGVINNQIYK